jgi:hypothetical protein
MTLVSGHVGKLTRLYFIYMGLAFGAAAALFVCVLTWRFIQNPILTIGICSLEFATAVLILRIASRGVRFLILAATFRDGPGRTSPPTKLRMRESATDLGQVATFGAGIRERCYMPPDRGFLWGLFSARTGEPRYGMRVSFALLAMAIVFIAVVGAMMPTNNSTQTSAVIKAGKPVVVTSDGAFEIR